ncbi:MAG: bifunctional metallophosphatase/5'-nucleotidase [Betaproteobacteria bacterium]|nr:bifunctional metallophosphatase/5'-nucleotidase [Betaproteobacteria bacterium]
MNTTPSGKSFWLVALAALAAAGLLAGCANAPRSARVDVTLIAFNDFHGNLKSPNLQVKMPDATRPDGVRPVVAGGVEAFSALVQKLRAEHPLTAVVSAGDLVGASPLLSALFDDQPTIEAMNLLGIDVHGVGNHEFDHGIAHLKRLQNGGCEPDAKTGKPDCGGRAPFAGARFPFLAANVIEEATGKPLFSPYAIKDFDGIKVAFIGLTLRDTPNLVRPGGTTGARFDDEVETVNRLVPLIQLQGVQAIVVLIHEGGAQRGGINDCQGFRGPIKEIAEQFDPAIQVVVSAHTHQAYICRFGERLITSAGSFGTLLTEIDLTLERASGKIVSARAENKVVATDGPVDARLSPMLARYTELAAPLENRIVAKVAHTLNRRVRPAGESELGNLIADAQLFGTSTPDKGGAEIAFNNQTSLRAAIAPDAGGNVSYGALFRAQPFQNDLVVMTLTGAQLIRALEHQWGADLSATERTLLDVSAGFHYQWDAAKPEGQRIVPGSVTLHGKPIAADATYRVAVNSFLAGGSEGHVVFTEGTERLVSVLDLEALVSYLEARNPYTPPPLGARVSRIH